MDIKYLRKPILDCNFYTIRQVLEQKCLDRGVKLVIASKYYPSSKMCSCCGSIKSLTLSDRIYECNSCGLVIDRDLNASINLMKLAKE